jgi:hypothetical protein
VETTSGQEVQQFGGGDTGNLLPGSSEEEEEGELNSDIDSSYSDSSIDFDMASSSLMPSPFKGLTAEDAESWIKDVEHYCAFRKLADEEKVGLIPLLLKDGAKYWYETLAAGNRANFDQIKQTFLEQYKRGDSTKWRDSADVWQTIQSRSQSVEDFISQVQQKALKAKMTEEQICFSILNGLKPNLRQVVVQHEPKSVTDIRKWATIAEASVEETAHPEVVKMIERLEEKLDKIHVRGVSENRSRSRTPTRVTFGPENRTRWMSTSPARSRTNQDRSTWTDRTPRVVYENTYRQQAQGQGQGPVGSNYSRQASGSRGTGGTSSGWTHPETRQLVTRTGQCYRCGISAHDIARHVATCPAKERTCFNCQKLGHVQGVCRSARRNQP